MRKLEEKRLVKMFKALANPTRLRLFVEIQSVGDSAYEEGGGCWLQTILRRLNLGAPSASHHLKELVNAGLVETERQGKFLRCRVEKQAVLQLRRFIG